VTWPGLTTVRSWRALRQAGASYEAIGRAAVVAAMTVHRLLHGVPAHDRPAPGRIRAVQTERLLAVTTAAVREAAPRRDAAGTRRRLRALIAMGHPAVSLARMLDVSPRVVWGIVRGTTGTVSRGMDAGVSVIYERTWCLRPPERDGAERRAAGAARRRAARCGWPAPMGLDDERIADPAYRPRAHSRAHSRPTSGTGAVRLPGRPPCAAASRHGRGCRRGPGQRRDRGAVS